MDPYWAFKATNHTKLSEPLLQRSVYLFALFKAQYLLPGDLKGDFYETSQPRARARNFCIICVNNRWSVIRKRAAGTELGWERRLKWWSNNYSSLGLVQTMMGLTDSVRSVNGGDEGDAFIVVLVVPSFRYGIECLRHCRRRPPYLCAHNRPSSMEKQHEVCSIACWNVWALDSLSARSLLVGWWWLMRLRLGWPTFRLQTKWNEVACSGAP